MEKITYSVGNLNSNYTEVVNAYRSSWYAKKLCKKFPQVGFDLDKDTLYALEGVGALLILIGRDKNGKLASVYTGAKSPFLFDKNLIYCHEIVWYMRPDLRGFKVLKEFITEIEKFLKIGGVDIWKLSVPLKEGKSLKPSRALARLGYEPEELVYMKHREG